MWFDELQAWNIARASHSLGDLYTNLRYEGHPILWYLPLYALTRFTGNPHSMQVVQWAVATGDVRARCCSGPRSRSRCGSR